MADKNDKYDENAKGKFYVDRSCIACDACYTTAPDNFQITEDYDHAFVMKQPENEEELERCQEALEGCPVEAIGLDGAEEE
ncbi:MAG: ferredoxin [Bdellovibrionaceae bacterium]|nr:ferredoxin [Pseudobdellovibrionaceae bacterium]